MRKDVVLVEHTLFISVFSGESVSNNDRVSLARKWKSYASARIPKNNIVINKKTLHNTIKEMLCPRAHTMPDMSADDDQSI